MENKKELNIKFEKEYNTFSKSYCYTLRYIFNKEKNLPATYIFHSKYELVAKTLEILDKEFGSN